MFKLKIIDKPEMFKMKCNFEFPKIPIENLQEKEVNPTTEKQEIVADKEYSALSKVMINAVTSDIDSNIQSYNIKKDVSILGVTGNVIELNGEERATTPTKDTQIITPSADKNAITKMTVNPIPDEYIVPSGEIEITANRIYNVTDKVSAKVNVPEKQLGAKTINKNGVYNATDDNLDGYSQVTVETSGVDINDYFWEDFNLYGGRYYGSSNFPKILKKVIINKTQASMGQTFADTNLETIIFKPTVAKQLTTAVNMFKNCTKLKTIEGLTYFDFSKVTNISSLFDGCESLESIPYFDTSSCTSMGYTFAYTKKITNIPLYDTSNVTNMEFMFYYSGITQIPMFNTSKVTNMEGIVRNTPNLEVFPELDTSNVTKMSGAFSYAGSLKEIKKINFRKVINVSSLFISSYELTILGGFENLGEGYLTTASANNALYTLDLSYCTKLTHDSLMNVINNLYDIATKGVATQQLVLGSTNISKLSAEEIQIATNKGFSVS